MFFLKELFLATVLLVGQTYARTSAGGACTEISDKRKCCSSYDTRLSTSMASNCVTAIDKFGNGAVCEAEAMVIATKECALVGSCQDHVQVGSAACLSTVIDKVRVKGTMHGDWIGGSEVDAATDQVAFRYNGVNLQWKKDNLFIFTTTANLHLKMTGATLEEMMDDSGVHTAHERDRYITLNGNQLGSLTPAVVSKIWDGLDTRFITVVVASSQGRTTDSNGQGYKLKDIDITVSDHVFTTGTTTTATTATTTTTTNTVLAQLNKDLEALKSSLSDSDVAKELGAVIDSVQTLEGTVEDEAAMRKASDAEVATLKRQVATLLPLVDRLEALEASVKAHMTLPTAIKKAVEDMQPKGTERCSSGSSCAPEVSATDTADLALTAKSGKVLMQTDACGATDMCVLVQAVQAMLDNFN